MDDPHSDCTGSLDVPSTIFLSLCYGLFGIVSIIGNSLVLWAIYRFAHLRTSSNYFLASMAAADLSVGLVIDPLWVARCILNQKPYQHPFKIAIDFFWLQTTVITTFSLCAVTIDRYVVLVYVYRYSSYVTVTRAVIIIAVIWTFSFAFAGLRLFISNTSFLPSLWISSLVLTFILPLVLMISCYAKILKVARKQSRQIRQQEASTTENSEREKQENESNNRVKRKANITVGLIVGLFTFLWLPSLVTSLVHVSITDSCLKIKLRRVWLWVEMIAFLSSAVNPWIYAIRNRDFRDVLRSHICVNFFN